MKDYGLNTVRIPVGYWMDESLVYAGSEHFPQGGLQYLDRICGWAADAGLFVVIDLHGAPGAQVADNPDTGQYAPTPGFYADYQYSRALSFLSWMTTNIHSNTNFRTVGVLEIVNEPVQNAGSVGTMLSSYYPNAFSTIRAAEANASVSSNDALTIMMMNEKWGSGNPSEYLSSTDQTGAAYDDHRYIKYDQSVAVSQSSYLAESCSDDRSGDLPTIVGEWSLSVPDDVQSTSEWDPSNSANTGFYQKWFAAQAMAYERVDGWIFWSWKAQLGDYRWSYQDAVAAGVIPTDLDTIYDMGACS